MGEPDNATSVIGSAITFVTQKIKSQGQPNQRKSKLPKALTRTPTKRVQAPKVC